MPTYGDLEGASYGELSRLTWAELESLSVDFWTLIRGLDAESREELEAGLRAGTLPPALVASGAHRYSKAEGAALELWTRYLPKTSMELGTWMLVLFALLNLMKSAPEPPPQAPPQVTVIVVQLPAEVRPPEQSRTEREERGEKDDPGDG